MNASTASHVVPDPRDSTSPGATYFSSQDAARLTGAPAGTSAGTALKFAALLWFAVTVVGQWVFLYYIVAFYGGSTLSGDFEAWDKNPMLRTGYVADDFFGNLAFASHVLLAAVIAFGGILQLIPQLRARAINVHRWNGRLFLLAAIVAALTGLQMIWIRGATDSMIGAIAITINAALILIFAGMAWRAVRRRDIASHRPWALRLFMVANGVFFIRLGVTAWMVLNQGQLSDTTFHVFEFACYLVPLALLELYLFAKDRGGTRLKLASAGALVVGAAYMSIGIFAFYMFVTQHILAAVA